MMPNHRWLPIVGCAVVWWGTIAVAQTFYKWTDDRGVVHFSDSPPANTKNVEERSLPGQEQVGAPPAEPASTGTPNAGASGQVDAGEQKEMAGEGPSRVILVSRQMPRTGPSAVHIIGRVKNVGGVGANGVSVAISAVDATQGTPCLRENAPVSPPTLAPGQSGDFDISLDSPCLYGEPNVDVTPVWE